MYHESSQLCIMNGKKAITAYKYRYDNRGRIAKKYLPIKSHIMKQLIFIIFTLFAFVVNANPQVLISTSDLKGTKWQHRADYIKGLNSYLEFNDGEWISHNHYISGSLTYLYYLSDSIDTKFDWSKVGQNTKGRYIIRINPQNSSIFVFSIQSFSKTNGEMVLTTERGGLYRVTNTHFLMPIDSIKHPKTFVGNGW